MTSWRPFGDISPAQLTVARLQAHYAAQWLARTARAYVPAKPDDSHTNLGWDDALDGFTTHALKGGARLGLRISDLTLILLDAKGGGFPLIGRSDTQARQWLGEELRARRMAPAALDAPSPYEMPPHQISGGAPYSGNPAELSELAIWFGNAHRSLVQVQRQMEARKLAASAARCWPHHFDVATLVSLDKAGGEHGRSVNAGFSPGDHYYDEPYFYVSPYPYPDAAKLPQLPAPGHWHTHEFTAAIAKASHIVVAKMPQGDVENFLRDAVASCIKLSA